MLPRRLLGPTVAQGEPRSETGRLVRVGGDADEIAPERFLGHAPTVPRHFWQQDEGWWAGLGEVARLEVRAGADPEGRRGTNGAGDRFSQVRARARRLAGDALVADEADPLRFVGGLAFHADHRPGDAWRGFPAARFTLPAVELVHDSRGRRYNVTVRVGEDVPEAEAVERAEDVLERVRRDVGPDDPRQRTTYVPPQPRNSTDRTAWRAGVESILKRAREGSLQKAVLARTVDAEARQEPAPTVVLGNLRQANPGTSLFLVQPGPGRAFLGAAPEQIGHVRDSILTASAVAGSVRRGRTADEDDELARELAASEKDRTEHDIVVRSMRRRLAKLAGKVEIGRETTILRLPGIQHLERDLYARLGPDQGILDAVQALHPTPAVCGHPREPARRLLREIEPFERGWYAAPVGWFEPGGDGAFAPALRCAVLQQDTWRLFAGAGVVEGSDPDREWEETRVKFEPVLEALGVRGAPP